MQKACTCIFKWFFCKRLAGLKLDKRNCQMFAKNFINVYANICAYIYVHIYERFCNALRYFCKLHNYIFILTILCKYNFPINECLFKNIFIIPH